MSYLTLLAFSADFSEAIFSYSNRFQQRDSVTLWLTTQTPNILCSVYLRAALKKMASWFASVASEEIIQIYFCGVYYLTVLLVTSVSVASGG